MKRLTTTLLVALTTLSTYAGGIYEVTLVSKTEHRSVTGGGAVYPSLGVTDAGLTATQLTAVHSSGMGYIVGGRSSASINYDVTLQVYWLQTGSNDGPPGTLYVSHIDAGTCTASATLQASPIGGFYGCSASSTAGSVSASASVPRPDSKSDSPPSKIVKYSDQYNNRSWIIDHTLGGGKIVWRLTDDHLLSFTTPSATATGSIDLAPGQGKTADGTSLSTGGLGLSYHVATIQYPPGGGGGKTYN